VGEGSVGIGPFAYTRLAMRIHDWTPSRAGRFHHLHQAWIYALAGELNGGLLPSGLYAAGEPIATRHEPDGVIASPRSTPSPHRRVPSDGAVLTLDAHPPRVHHVLESERYAGRQDSLAIRLADGDQLVAAVEIVSPGNKDSRHRFEQLVDKIVSLLDRGVHVLLVDLFPPGNIDPEGVHGAVWSRLVGNSDPPSLEAPLVLVAYHAHSMLQAYVEWRSVGSALPDMPLFLDADRYVTAPLSSSYARAWDTLPAPWRDRLEAGSLDSEG